MHGWAELYELGVDEGWQDKGIRSWLVRHALRRLRLAGCRRIVLWVDGEDKGRGAGRFYRRFGWTVLATTRKGWKRTTL